MPDGRLERTRKAYEIEIKRPAPLLTPELVRSWQAHDEAVAQAFGRLRIKTGWSSGKIARNA